MKSEAKSANHTPKPCTVTPSYLPQFFHRGRYLTLQNMDAELELVSTLLVPSNPVFPDSLSLC